MMKCYQLGKSYVKLNVYMYLRDKFRISYFIYCTKLFANIAILIKLIINNNFFLIYNFK